MYYSLNKNGRITISDIPSDNDLDLTDEEYNALMEGDGVMCDFTLVDGKLVGVVNQEELKENLRNKRETECFSVINRGQFWYETLTEEQKAELKVWYQDWLDVTETKVVPEKPSWL
jgi:hypothetical protein